MDRGTDVPVAVQSGLPGVVDYDCSTRGGFTCRSLHLPSFLPHALHPADGIVHTLEMIENGFDGDRIVIRVGLGLGKINRAGLSFVPQGRS